MSENKIVAALIVGLLAISCAHSQPQISQPSSELYRAAGKGELSELSKANEFQINGSNQMGTTLLMVAARRNRPESVNYLLGRGASVNVADIHKQTALHYSLPSRNSQITESLIKAGADPSTEDSFGVVPVLMWAEEGAFNNVLLALEKRQNWCCFDRVKVELHNILNAELTEKSYIPPSLFIVLKELEN